MLGPLDYRPHPLQAAALQPCRRTSAMSETQPTENDGPTTQTYCCIANLHACSQQPPLIIAAACKNQSTTCMSIGVNGVRGVPGKLLPMDDGVLGIEPERLRGGLKSDSGVGGADLAGDPMAPPPSPPRPDGEPTRVPCSGESLISSVALLSP